MLAGRPVSHVLVSIRARVSGRRTPPCVVDADGVLPNQNGNPIGSNLPESPDKVTDKLSSSATVSKFKEDFNWSD